MKKTIFISLIFILSISPSFVYGQKDKTLKDLKDSLNNQMGKISELGARIRSLEKNLGDANETYMAKLKEVRRLDEIIHKMKMGLNSSTQDISSHYKVSKKILNHYLLDIADENSTDLSLKKKIYIKLLKNKIQDLEAAQNNSQKLFATLKEYEDRLDQTKKDEGSLYKLLVDLEEQKKNLGQQYVTSMELKNEYEENLEEALARQRVKQKSQKVEHSNIELNLRKPLDHYVSYKGSKKGVTFKFSKVAPIYSTGNGKVVYAGELASYGKVIMVDHGQEIRSVLLGDMAIKVQKGDIVKQGSILAYTNSDPGITKSLYYEVRKKNIAQNTLNILKKSNKNI